MFTRKLLAAVIASSLGGGAFSQEPPQVQPQITPTVVPPAVQLTGPVRNDLDVSRPLGVDEAVKLALVHQTAVQIAKAQVDAAKGRTRQAESGELPTVGLSAGYSKVNRMSGSVVTSSGYTAGATLNQLIFDFNVTRDSIRQAKALERLQTHVLTQTQSDTVLTVKQAFYAYAQDMSLVSVAEANLHDREGQLALAKARFTEGVGAPADVVSAQTNLDSAVLALTQARSTALVARVALAQAIGVDPLTPITLQSSAEPETKDELPTLLKSALAQRPEILAAKESLLASTLGVSVAGKSNDPSLFLTLGVSGQGDTSFTSTGTRDTLGISLSWSFYDGGLAAGKQSEAKANQAVSKKQLEQLNQNVVTDVANVYVALKTAEQAVVITTTQVSNAQESVRLAEGRYKAGIATFLEVIDAETALTQAKINQVNALSTVQAERAALAHSIGANPLR